MESESIEEKNSVIEQIIQKNLSKIQYLGDDLAFFPGGHNGPYYDIESPVRNTAHWLVTYSINYMQSKDPELRNIIQYLCNYLCQTNFIKYKTFIHRQKKDWANGVIGQAWVIEALNIANKILHSDDITDFLKKIGDSFTFNKGVSAWSRVNPRDGKEAVDYTLNHQLWYAAALMESFPESKYQVDEFLNVLNYGAFRVRNDGLICHLMYSKSVKGKLLKFRYRILEKRNYSAVLEKELGYHLFNLYPLARLYKHLPDHDFFNNASFLKSLNFIFSESFSQRLLNNKYSYPYNSPAFEFPLVFDTFKHLLPGTVAVKGKEIEKQMMGLMLEKTFINKSSILSKNCPDPLTLTARVYEYYLGKFYSELF